MARFDLRTGVPRSQSAFRCYAAGKRRFKLIPLLLPEPVPAKGLGERAKRGIKVKKAGDMVAATMITKLDSTDSASLKQIAKATQITSKISERNEKQMVSSASTMEKLIRTGAVTLANTTLSEIAKTGFGSAGGSAAGAAASSAVSSAITQ